MSNLGERIRSARKALGFEQRDLAELLNVKQQTISKLETGKAKGTYIAPKLAQALQVDLTWLLTGDHVLKEEFTTYSTAQDFASIRAAAEALSEKERTQLIKLLAKSLPD